ncbi:hypothetical protein Rs2_18714 [Raphanus sativus]|nr:hypothetical protein Rs2_18714 [Raphanus sativus]
MLGKLLSCFSSIHVGLQVGYLISILLEKGIPKLLEQTSRRFPKRNLKSFEVEDRISALPDDLLVRILLFVPTKYAVLTMILSKRWRSIWKMVPELNYLEMINDDTNKVIIGGLLGRLLERFFGRSDQRRQWLLRFIDESLQAHKAPVLESLLIEVDTGRQVDVDVGNWIKKAVHRRVRELGFILRWSAEPTRLPNNLYTCDTLVSLGLSNKVLVDVPSLACLPSLKNLQLDSVVYKDEDSLARLFLSCPLLKKLIVERHHQDNLAWFSTIGYSHLMECKIILVHDLDWLQPLMMLLQNSPNLKVLLIDKTFLQLAEELPLSWNQPSSVPGCLSTHLEIFEWREYEGRNEEREFINYIFANSECLKRAGFSLKSTSNHKDRKKMKDLESMYRVSASSQLLFSTHVEYMSVSDELRA